MCRHSEAMGGGALDCVGGTQSVVAANIIRRNNRNSESSESFLYPGSLSMLLNRLYPRYLFLITIL